MLYRIYSNSNHCLFGELLSASIRVRHTRAAAAHPLEFEVSRCRTSQFARCLQPRLRFECGMTFPTLYLPPERWIGSRRSSHVKSDNTHTIITTPLSHILDTCPLIFSIPTASYVTASHLSPGDNHQSTGGQSERTQCQAKWPSETHSVTYAPGLPLFISFAYCRAASTVTHLLPKATSTPSIQPNLGLPCTRHPLTSAINTLPAIRYSSILSTCPNHLNTL